MTGQTLARVPGPAGRDVARVLAGLVRDPLGTYLRLVGRYGEAVRMLAQVTLRPGRCLPMRLRHRAAVTAPA